MRLACRQSLHIQTRIVILQHHREQNLSTNTARLAVLAVPGCQIRQRGIPELPLHTDDLTQNSWLLYPSEDATSLGKMPHSLGSPLTLIVPDGSWRQASKVSQREPELRTVPRVMLPEGAPTRYLLRREPKVGGLATFEAIARALGVLEGPGTQTKLEALFNLMVERTLRSRGVPVPAF